MGRDLRPLSPPSKTRARLFAALGLLTALLVVYWLWPPPDRATKGAATATSSVGAAPRGPLAPTIDSTAAWQAMGGVTDGGAETATVVKTPKQLRIEHAQVTLDTYLAWARYPPESRPLSEHPDRQTTDYSQANKQFFVRKNGVKRTDVYVKKTQSHAFVVGDEKIRLEVSCENQGQVLPCTIGGAEASVVGAPGATPVSVRFTDDGLDGDEKAGDSVFTATLQPGTTSLAGKDARIGVAVWLNYQTDQGQVFFQFDYTAAEPARFTGKVTEAIENGSLALYLEFDVRNAGRYALAARADDAGGTGFGYLEHIGPLTTGLVKVRFVVFGKLIKDQKVSAPFKVRDLNGFLLKEDVNPDREVIKDTKGVFHTTKAYADGDFSDAEWQSDDKKRHVDEYTKDLEAAKAGKEGPAGPAVAPPP